MSESDNIRNYSAADIEKYHRGQLSPAERNAMERAALEDPFLADALEGFAAHAGSMENDLADLRQRLNDRIQSSAKKPVFAWWKIAAMIVLVLGTALIIYQLSFTGRQDDIAQALEKNPAPVKKGDSMLEKMKNPREEDSSTSLPEEMRKPSKNLSEGRDSRSPSPGLEDEFAKPERDNKKISAKQEEAREATIEFVNPPSAEHPVEEKKEEKSAAVKAANAPQPMTERAARNLDGRAAGMDVKSLRKEQGEYHFIFRGRITDKENKPLPFASISVPVKEKGFYADANGNFEMKLEDSLIGVRIGSVGYEEKEITLKSSSADQFIALQESVAAQSEVVVTGYGKQRGVAARMTSNNLNVAEPADGWDKYQLYIKNNLRMPREYTPADTAQEVILSFQVDRAGTPEKIKVEKKLCPACDSEAIRLLREGPKWKNRQKNKRSRITIHFK